LANVLELRGRRLSSSPFIVIPFLVRWFVNLVLFCCFLLFFVFCVILRYLASRWFVLCDMNSRAEGW